MKFGRDHTSYDTLHIFGCPAYYHIRDDKNDPRAGNGLFMGSSSGVGGYKLWCLCENKMIVSRDVTIDEASMLKMSTMMNVDSSRNKENEVSVVVHAELATSWKPKVTILVESSDSCSEDEKIPIEEISQR